MAWQTPKTNWQAADVVRRDDFNRIEGNIQHLADTKETPAGAQAKADAAEARAKAYTDQEVAEVSQALDAHKAAAAPHSGHETPAGAQAKANTAEANAKAYTDAHEQKPAPHSGHETPAGAQAKAEAAAGAVQAELNTHKAESAIHKTSVVIRTETETKLKVEVVSSSVSETPDAGRIIFDTSQGKFFGGNGTEWV